VCAECIGRHVDVLSHVATKESFMSQLVHSRISFGSGLPVHEYTADASTASTAMDVDFIGKGVPC